VHIDRHLHMRADRFADQGPMVRLGT
jgi:hypothetical protein